MGTRSNVGNELFSEAKEDITDFLKTRTCSMFVTRSGGGPGPAAAAVVNCGRVFGIFCPVWNISQSQQPRGNILILIVGNYHGFWSFHLVLVTTNDPCSDFKNHIDDIHVAAC